MDDGHSFRDCLEEALVLALHGRLGDARRLLDDLESRYGPEQQSEVGMVWARMALRLGAKASHAEARETIEQRARQEEKDWRAPLDLARLELSAGDREAAARLLQDAVQRFREHRQGDETPLARMLTREAERLTTARHEEEPSREAQLPSSSGLVSLIDLGRRLAGQTDPNEVLRTLLHESAGLVDAERGFVVRVRGDELEFAVAETMDRTEVEEPMLEVSRALIREVHRTRQVEFVSVVDLPADHPAGRSLSLIGTQSVACVPLAEGNEILGVLYLDGTHIAAAQRGEVTRLLELLGGQAAAALRNAEEHQQTLQALETAEETLRRHREAGRQRDRYDELLGSSAAMQTVYRQLDRIMATEEPVILTGETGTGKDLAARIIHARGPRSGGEFVAVNCASLSESLLESELFGYERGAFTGADRARPGLFEVADRGTLFMDEIGDMSPRMQADLLRALQSGEVRRIGARQARQVSVRILAATHRDLESLVEQGAFRQDLYYRLHVLSLRMPALRERPDDIEPMIERLLPKLAGERPVPSFAEDAMARLRSYGWPGNVRELENVLRRLLASGCSSVHVRDLPAELLAAPAEPAPCSLAAAEADAIGRALKATKGNKAKAARILGINRATLYAKLKAP